MFDGIEVWRREGGGGVVLQERQIQCLAFGSIDGRRVDGPIILMYLGTPIASPDIPDPKVCSPGWSREDLITINGSGDPSLFTSAC